MHCFVDYRITKEELLSLSKLDLKPILVPKCNDVYDAINGHPDIQLNVLKNDSFNKIIIQRNISENFKEILKLNDINYIVSKNTLSNTYPNDIILNSLILENYFIHTLKYSDENLLNSQNSKIHIDVPQGYTKCSILPVREKALITSDKGIFNSLKNYDFDILLLPPGDILLPSLNYGFIGGVGGMVSNNKMAFFGDLDSYTWGDQIKKFLFKYDILPIALRKGKLIDRGSLFTL
ncbi:MULTISPECIES: DUF6873 family GME fold protein [Clostridium]|jgi:hypothetical protein|uniref:DUF6873 domain-containing protein n=2 Tax=Clostridium beijerinckii TaxID=1520 RepID=A0AAE2RXI3_CLOBE|nr:MULTISPECIES: hypothetical protein [Clostridium]ABR33741.1 conserved hypothetical protein [Clostridium beijerinckii NCIMB 8052]AIU01128.1 hypothetical protein Cbs_1567 [Clostridium beijerinckii ATCC 35702]ALB47150.1 hypothetical protein X276_18820 [Clostridium beijerinckii NRRL B-598]AVK50580.1 hypothetical protein AXY43_22625 [Clostridium sp. MF28]MBF7812163.1 hypothetical protein [Clostridium beijerinckii]